MRKRVFKGMVSLVLASVLALSVPVESMAYTVQKGDTLSKISIKYGTPVSKLKELNGITDGNKIYVGQELNVGDEGNSHNDRYYDRVDISKEEASSLYELFDAEWYAKAYPDVVAVCGDSKDALFNHYLGFGLWETRQPNKDFNVNVYGTAYKDLQDAYEDMTSGERVLNLTLHYATCGKEEKRDLINIDAMFAQGFSGFKVYYYGAYHDINDSKTQEGGIVENIIAPVSETVSEPNEPEKHVHTVVKDAAIPATLGGNGLSEGSHCSVCGEILEEQKVVSNEDVVVQLDDSIAYCLMGMYGRPYAIDNFKEISQVHLFGAMVCDLSKYWGFDIPFEEGEFDDSGFCRVTMPREMFDEATEMMFGRSLYEEYCSGKMIYVYQDTPGLLYDAATDSIIWFRPARGGGPHFQVSDITVNGNSYVYEISEYEWPYQGGAFIKIAGTIEATMVDDHLQLDSVHYNDNWY